MIKLSRYAPMLLGALLVSAGLPRTAHAADAQQAVAADGTVSTRHVVRIGGVKVSYRADVDTTTLSTPQGQPGARIVSFSYLREGVRDTDARPVLFVFNGGPGSASVWTHLGLVGPRRIDLDNGNDPEEVRPPTTPPFHLVDNADSVLDVADVVLFDPPGTGYSRVLPGVDAANFYGVDADAAATQQFITDWLTRHHRLNSPRYLMGESYGTVRAAEVAKRLAGGPFGSHHMDALTLDGVILLGQSMDMRSHNAMHTALTVLPTLAALDWYHFPAHRQGQTLQQRVAAARAFAGDEYVRALYAGDRLDTATRKQIADKLAALTGLPAGALLGNDLLVSGRMAQHSLLPGRVLGQYDGRYTLPAANDGGDPVADDPAMAQYTPAFAATIQDYVHDELHADIDGTYQSIDFTVNGRWNYGYGPGVPPNKNFAPDLATAMRRNPQLCLFVGMGYYDLTTPMGEAEYVLAHDGFDPARVQRHYYASGHMAYLGRTSREQLAADLRAFLRGNAGGE